MRIKHTNRKDGPINTWAPWNPVVTKNVDPKILSAIENEAVLYSLNCKNVKYRPKDTVRIRA